MLDRKRTTLMARSGFLRSDLEGIKKRIRRLVMNLEAQVPSSELADDIRYRLEEPSSSGAVWAPTASSI
jgi:hypothetical protein